MDNTRKYNALRMPWRIVFFWEEKTELYKENNKSKRVYTEFAVAKKNIDYILDKDNEQYEESHKKDDYEQSK